MFNNKLSETSGVIFAIFIALISLMLIMAIMGRIILYIYGRKIKISQTGQQIINSLNIKNKSLLSTIVKTKFTPSWLTSCSNKTQIIKFNNKTLIGANIDSLFKIVISFDLIGDSKFGLFSNKIQLWGIIGLFILALIDAMIIAILIIIVDKSDSTYDGTINHFVQIIIEGLSIFGWFLLVSILLWWIKLLGAKTPVWAEDAKKILNKKELTKFNRYLKIISHTPFSIRLFI